MNEPMTTGGTRIEWLPPSSGIQWLSIVIEVADPSPDAAICYTATWPPRAGSRA